MHTEIALDLRLARVKSGLTQRDVAHLLDVNLSTLSRLENGNRSPSLDEIVCCSLIYGRSFESFFALLVEENRTALLDRLPDLPPLQRECVGTVNRPSTIARMQSRLAAMADADGAA